MDSEKPANKGFVKGSKILLGKTAGILVRQTLAVVRRIGGAPGKKDVVMQSGMNVVARSVGGVVGGISIGLSHLLRYGAGFGREGEAGQVVRKVQFKRRSHPSENRLEKLYSVPGRKSCRISDRKKDFLTEERIRILIKKIESCQSKLGKISEV